ncbi:MAG: WG repeat-containing protein [Eubacteriales bacterium]
MNNIIRVLSVLLLAGVCVGVILYARSLPPSTQGSTEHSTSDTTQPSPTQPSTPPPDSLADQMDPDALEQSTTSENTRPTVSAFEDAISAYEEYGAVTGQGYYLSDGLYEKYDESKTQRIIDELSAQRQTEYDEDILYAHHPEMVEAEDPPIPPVYEYKWTKLIPKTELGNTLYAQSNSQIISVVPRMGYIFNIQGNNTRLLDADTSLLLDSLPGGLSSFTNNRDGDNNPVFSINGEYKTFDKASGSFIESAYNPAINFRGTVYPYPSWYGLAGDTGMTRFTNSKGSAFGFKRVEGGIIVDADYSAAYNFSEGVGCIVTSKQQLYFFNERGILELRSYFAPDEVTQDTLGYFYFDHGLTRAIKRTTDRKGNIIENREILIYRDGSEFLLPQGYKIKAYSCGVILLEKNGKYGFMNYAGDWIAQPIYTYARPFSEGVAVVGLPSGKKALIDTAGSLIVRFAADYISDCSGGVVALYSEGEGWRLLAKTRRNVEVSLPAFVYPSFED